MSKNSYKKYILFIIIFFVKEINNKENELKNINKIYNNWIINEYCLNLELYNNENEYHNLELKYNLISLENETLNYILDLKNITDEDKDKELLLYTNLTNKLIYLLDNNNTQEIPLFYIISNEYIKNNESLRFQIDANNVIGKGFIDFLFVNKGEFEVNQNIIREEFYSKNITIKKAEFNSHYYINFIPTDNNSDLYYLQFSYNDSISSGDKEKIKLYYLNNINNNTIEGIINDIKHKPMKRDRKINGKIEIFAIEYNKLEKDNALCLKYNKIKGEGILGFILTLSILFFFLIILVSIFLKNIYCGSIKISSISEDITNNA